MNREQLRIAIQNLRANQTRTLLTTLGIIIGVASITLVLALGEGVKQAVERQVQNLEGNVIIVKPGASGKGLSNIYNPYSSPMTTSLTERDYTSVSKLPNVQEIAPVMILGGSLKSSDTAVHAPIIATSETLPTILGLKMRSGQFIDGKTSRDTVVVGQQLALELFGTDEAMGQSMLVKGRPHTVIGIVKNTKTPLNLSGINLDKVVYVSLDDGKSFNQGIAQIQQLNIRVKDVNQIADTTKTVDETILKNHSGERDFTALAGEDIAGNSNDLFSSVVALTAIVSIVTLIVSGIGVMNIMLVGVTERTREIGIRKALGATNQHIMGQFLVESLIMSITGGLIGMALAYALAFIIASELSFQPSLSPGIFATGFGLALAVGIIFGLYPAIKAAKKDPIDSLRQYQ